MRLSLLVLFSAVVVLAQQNPFTEHINRGKTFMENHDWENARREFWLARDAASTPKENAVAAWRTAQAYRAEGKIDEALDSYKMSLEYMRSDQALAEMQELELQRFGKTIDAAEIHRALARRTPFAEEGPSIDLEILFDFDKSTLTDDGKAQVRELAKALSADDFKSKSFLIIGHTDSVGSPDYNRALSIRRAKTVSDAVLAQTSLSADRIQCEGKGMTDPKYSGDSEEVRRLNRRVQVTVKN